MDDNAQDSSHTHFSSTQRELPVEYYAAMGRALYRWTQLEATVCSLATSVLGTKWLETLKDLRGKNDRGFILKQLFDQLLKKLRESGDDEHSRAAIERALGLYEKRKAYFHSIWGVVSNKTSATVGIQEWSPTSYDNFRAVSVEEIHEFAAACQNASIDILKTAIPFFHGGDAIAVDDEEGIPRPLIK